MRSILLFACALLCLTGCRDRSPAIASPSGGATLPALSSSVGKAVWYSLVIPTSFVNWKGMHVIGGNGHQGYIKALAGSLAFDEKGSIAAGNFELDMKTITLTDKKDTSSDNGLVSHLKDSDFFDVENYPKALFQLTKASKVSGDSSYFITGRLTLRAVTQEIQFPATVVRDGEYIVATASLSIDRTRWGITYKSGSVWGLMKDELLENLIPVSLVLHFRKNRGC